MDVPAHYVQVDALYFQATESATDTAFHDGKLITPKFNTRWGVRAKTGFSFCPDGWEVGLQFLHYHGRTTEEIGGGDYLPTRGYPETVGIVDNFRSRWRLHLGFLDLYLTKGWEISPRLSLTPFAAIRFAGVRHKSRIIYRNAQEVNLSMKNKFWGIGPEVGLESLWHLRWGTSLFVRGACSLLWGEVYLHQDQNDAKFFSEYDAMQKVGEMGIGLDFRKCFSCVELYLRAGWELYFLPGQNRLARFTTQAQFVGSGGDLSMQGLSLGLGLYF